jgi:hypothetical protein
VAHQQRPQSSNGPLVALVGIMFGTKSAGSLCISSPRPSRLGLDVMTCGFNGLSVEACLWSYGPQPWRPSS